MGVYGTLSGVFTGFLRDGLVDWGFFLEGWD